MFTPTSTLGTTDARLLLFFWGDFSLYKNTRFDQIIDTTGAAYMTDDAHPLGGTIVIFITVGDPCRLFLFLLSGISTFA